MNGPSPAHQPAVDAIRAATSEAEQVLLGAMLYPDTARPRQAPRLGPEEWQETVHASIAGAVWALRDRSIRAEPAMVAAYLEREGQLAEAGGLQYLAGLIRAAPSVGDEVDSARYVRGLAAKRALYAASQELAELALQPDLTAGEAVGRIGPTLARVSAGEVTSGLTLRELARREATALRQNLACYSTGLRALDEVMLGGLYEGKLYSFAARMKKGKSLTLGHIAYNLAAQGIPTLLLALEMGDAEFAHRLLASLLGTSSVRFLSRPARDLPDRVDRLADSDNPALDNLWIEDRPGCTLDSLRRVVGDYRAKHGIKANVLDYWQKVSGRQRDETDVAHLGNVAAWMAQDAKANGCVWATAAQINRQGDTRGGDGLRVESSMYLHMHQENRGTEGVTELWMEMEDTRYTPRQDVGSAEQPKLYIDRVGPRLAEWDNRA